MEAVGVFPGESQERLQGQLLQVISQSISG